MRMMTLCRQCHQQPNALLQQSDLRLRLTITMKMSYKMSCTMNSEVVETMILQLTMIVMISVVTFLTLIV